MTPPPRRPAPPAPRSPKRTPKQNNPQKSVGGTENNRRHKTLRLTLTPAAWSWSTAARTPGSPPGMAENRSNWDRASVPMLVSASEGARATGGDFWGVLGVLGGFLGRRAGGGQSTFADTEEAMPVGHQEGDSGIRDSGFWMTS